MRLFDQSDYLGRHAINITLPDARVTYYADVEEAVPSLHLIPELFRLLRQPFPETF